MDSSDPTVDCCNISSRRSRSNQYIDGCHVDHKSATPSSSRHCRLESLSLRIYRLLHISSRRSRSNQYIDGCDVGHKSATPSSSRHCKARIVELTDLSFFVRKFGCWRNFDMPRFKKLKQHDGSTPLKAPTKALRKLTTTPQKLSKFNLTRLLDSNVAKTYPMNFRTIGN